VAPILRLMMKTDEFRGDSRDHREVNKRCGLFHWRVIMAFTQPSGLLRPVRGCRSPQIVFGSEKELGKIE